jgi:K+-sensing histidine kinase KdpD
MNDEGEMHTIEERFPPLEGRTMFRWPRFLLESVLAIGGSLAVTGLIGFFHLYPTIPNISLVYLLLILVLASTFGRYAAVLASVTAFLAFDYFLVPPFYTFVIARWEEWIALFVFLVTALLTSQLSALMRQRTDQAQQQVRETRILYELLRYANTHERSEELLRVVAYTTLRVFTSWGVKACALLFLDEHETLTTMADVSSSNEPLTFSSDERLLAVASMTEGRIKEKRSGPPPDSQDAEHNIHYYATMKPVTIVRFIPLQTGRDTFGLLCLRMEHPVPWFADVSRMEKDRARSESRAAFFWTYLEQVTSLIERAFLRSAAVLRSE